ncbi:hypothetical protein Tco_1318127 [Tanacetum coccineum]
MEHPFEQPSPEHQPSSPRQESDIPQTQAPTHTHEAETGHMSVDDLFQLVPQLMTRIESLEKDLKQTKQTMGNAIVKLVKKVKKMEKGRNLQKDESEVFETPKQGKSLGETYISPQGLEAAETLAEALSQIKTKRRNVKTRVRRRLDVEDVSTSLEGVSTGLEDVSTGFEDVSTGFTDIKSASEKVSFGGEHAKLEANADLVKEIVGEDVSEADYAQSNGGFDKSEKKTYCKAKDKSSKRLTNDSGSAKTHGKVLCLDTEKESRKRTGVELQTESSKKLKSDTREDVSVPKRRIKSQMLKFYNGRKEWNDTSSKAFPNGVTIPTRTAHCQDVNGRLSRLEREGLMKSLKGFYGGSKDYVDPHLKEDAIGSCHINKRYSVAVCKAMLEKKLLGDRKDEEAHNEDIQRNLKFTSEDQVRGGLLGIIVNRLKSGSYRVKSGRHS